MPLPITVPAEFRIIAHRGASAYAPENTAPAFRLAHDMGSAEVELDAQLTTDGEIALVHDRDLARYGHGPQVVEQMSWAALAALDMGAWFSPFLYGGTALWRLDDLFAAYGDRFVYHVEIKGAVRELPAAVHAAILRHGLADQCIVTSFSYDALAAMHAIDADVRLGWLVHDIDDAALARARDLKLFQLCPAAATVTPEQVAQARRVTPEVRAWGLSGQHAPGAQSERGEVIALVERVLAAGCDGMTINWPDWVRH